MQRDREEEAPRPAHYRDLFMQLGAAILLTDAAGRIVDANRAALTLLGYDRPDLLELGSEQLLSASAAVVAEARAAVRRRGRWQGRLLGRCQDGAQPMLDVRIQALRDAEGPHFALLLRPSPAEEPSGVALPVLSAALDQANDAVMITNAALEQPGPQIVYINAAFTAMNGYRADELIGQTPRILQGPETDRAVLDQARGAMERGAPFHGEVINYRKDGSSYVLEWHIAPVRDAAGTITHWISIQQDISARKQAAAERERLYQEAQTALNLRDQLLTMVSHELKTPLTSLIGYTYLLKRMMSDEQRSTPRAQQALTIISQQAQRLNTLIEELLDLERLEGNSLLLRCEPLDIVDLARRVVAEFQPLLERHTLTIETPEQPQTIHGDELRLRHAVQQLIENAVAYSPEGGTIKVEIKPQTERICLSVRDQGIGIPATGQEQIFQRFYRASNVNPSQISGFGVGLYMVREIVMRHGGSIEVVSAEGQGSTFTIFLPRP